MAKGDGIEYKRRPSASGSAALREHLAAWVIELKVCAFTCCNSSYLPQAVVALTSARKWMPDIALLLVADSLTSTDHADLARYDIEALTDPLSGHFSRSWDYPRPCYFVFAAPELLCARGYDVGLYVDADVIVNGDLSKVVTTTRTIAGVEVGSLRAMLKNDVGTIESHFGALRDIQRIQSGVLTMNFAPLVERGFLPKLSRLYDRCLEIGAPRRGDDSLLALAQHVHPEIGFATLAPAFNIIEYQALATSSEEWQRRGEATLAADAIFHFAGKSQKPWADPDRFPSFRAKYFTRKWQRHAVDALQAVDLELWFPSLAKSLRSDHLRFYWYPETNVGDQITPYFLSRFAETVPMKVTERGIKKIERKAAKRKRFAGFVRRLTGRKEAKRARYITSCGSIVRLCGDHALVFGSGIRSADQAVARPFIRFVRGPLTRERLLQAGVECPAVFGDPALLLPRVFNPPVAKIHQLGIIPHFTEVETVLQCWELRKGQTILDPRTDDVEAFILCLLQCERTLSSSLHGLIFSHAYGIPTRHVLITDTIFGDGIKYRDHYATVKLHHNPVDLRAGNAIGPELAELANEIAEFDDRFLWDECFFDESGLKNSLRLPY